MKVSVIIPTYNASHYLPALLKKLKYQSIAFELIIIDSSSQDNTLEIAEKYADIIITIPTKEFDHGGTRTVASKRASGEIVVFLTQDALPCTESTIETIVKVFKNKEIGAAYGRQIPYENTSLFGKHLRAFNYPPKAYVRTFEDRKTYGIKTAFLSDSFAAYRKSSLERIGWFKDGLIVGEDSYAGAKIILNGYALAYCAEAAVYHSHSYTLFEEFKRYFDIGVFHQKEQWILENFGKAEGEGGKYVKSEFRYLLKHHAFFLIPEFFIRNGMKYMGYKLGQSYKSVPLKLVKKLSMHYRWWDKQLYSNN